jgi:hypothetical protein
MALSWTTYTDPVFANQANTIVNCQLTLSNGMTVPFTANPDDPEPMGQAVYSAIMEAAATTPIAPYTAPTPPVLTLAQQAAAALNAGLTITSTGPTLTMTATLFPCDTTTTSKISIVTEIVMKTSAVPGNVTTYPMKDMANPPVWHQFTVDQYEAIALAIASYVAPLQLIIDGNPANATALPQNSVTISV